MATRFLAGKQAVTHLNLKGLLQGRYRRIELAVVAVERWPHKIVKRGEIRSIRDPHFTLAGWNESVEWRQIRGDCRKSIESLPTVLLLAA